MNPSYDYSSKPKTSYPDKLIGYLCYKAKIPPPPLSLECNEASKVLDVGCGRGDFINAFNKLGFDCYAVDIEVRTKDLHNEVKFNTCDFENERLPYDSNSFDLVFTKSVIEHILNYHHFIAECKRVLKPGGTLIIMTPDWRSCLYIFYGNYTHVHPYIDESLSKLILAHDLAFVSCERFVQHPAVWHNPLLKAVCKVLQFVFGPPRKTRKSSFFRWSRELILLAIAKKQ